MQGWDIGAVLTDTDLLLLGLCTTMNLFGLALLFGVPLGLDLAPHRMSRIPVLSRVCSFIIEFFRTSAPLAQLFWFFFALPILISVQIKLFVASVITFSVQSSAFFAVIFRGGINSIDKGQWDATRAIGICKLETPH